MYDMIKKRKILGFVILFFVFVFAFRVIAAGTSEGGDINRTSWNNVTNNSSLNATDDDDGADENGTADDENETDDDYDATDDDYRNGTKNNKTDTRIKDCSKLPKEMGRIRCRLKHGDGYVATPGEIPEACKLRTEEKRGRCIAFYNAIQKCYNNKQGKEKDNCFRKASGLKKKFSEEAVEGRKDKARNYMVTLLYELEERVEKYNEKEKISEDKSAEIIAKIIEIKKSILEGENKESIRPELSELKQLWRASITRQIETEAANG